MSPIETLRLYLFCRVAPPLLIFSLALLTTATIICWFQLFLDAKRRSEVIYVVAFVTPFTLLFDALVLSLAVYLWWGGTKITQEIIALM